MAKTERSRRVVFIAEWYQEEAAIVRPFVIVFYLSDNEIEIFDKRSNKVFLRRTRMPDLSERDFFIGSKVNIFGRQFDIVDYGDELTRTRLEKLCKKTFVLLKNTVVGHLGTILCALNESNFIVNKGLMVQFNAEQATQFLGEQNKGNVETSVLMNQLISGPTIAFELIADNAVEKIKFCKNQTSECVATNDISPALIALFEKEEFRNGIYCSKTDEDVVRESAYFFESSNFQSTCVLDNSTLCIIKPHCMKDGNVGEIIKEITGNGFQITALRMHLLERVNCAEFYEVYRGILPEYIPMVAQLSSGVSMALELVCTDPSKNTYTEFRNFCGPMDPEIAKLLRPHTLRAKFGNSKTLNGVHCTDLPDDTVLELQYLFKILD